MSDELGQVEQRCLVRAIETAIEVQRPLQFHDWLDGPFRDLLPHESMVCLEIGEHGRIRQVDFLHHGLVDAGIIDLLCNPEYGLAPLLTRLSRAKARTSYAVDARRLATLLATRDDSWSSGACPLNNAVVHRTRFLSGAAYFFILFNVPAERLARSAVLFKLLSSHLKQALSCVINTQAMNSHVNLTERESEILRQMAAGKSSRAIGVAVGISPITVKSHIAKIYRKLDVQNRSDAIARGEAILNAVREDAGQ